jgi:hypothetical protein
MATTAVALTVGRKARDWVGDLAWVGDSTAWYLHYDAQWTPLSRLGEESESGWYPTAVRP